MARDRVRSRRFVLAVISVAATAGSFWFASELRAQIWLIPDRHCDNVGCASKWPCSGTCTAQDEGNLCATMTRVGTDNYVCEDEGIGCEKYIHELTLCYRSYRCRCQTIENVIDCRQAEEYLPPLELAPCVHG